jgi:hypothetical protein
LGAAFFSWSFFPGIGVLIAANLAALRSRRARTEELYLSLPMLCAHRNKGLRPLLFHSRQGTPRESFTLEGS